MEDKPKKNLKWLNNLRNHLYGSNGWGARRIGTFNGQNLVLYVCNYESLENFLLCFKDGTPGPFKILLQQNDKIGRENLLADVSLASSEEFLIED